MKPRGPSIHRSHRKVQPTTEPPGESLRESESARARTRMGLEQSPILRIEWADAPSIRRWGIPIHAGYAHETEGDRIRSPIHRSGQPPKAATDESSKTSNHHNSIHIAVDSATPSENEREREHGAGTVTHLEHRMSRCSDDITRGIPIHAGYAHETEGDRIRSPFHCSGQPP